MRTSLTFSGVGSCLLKVYHDSTLDFLHQRLQALVQHALRKHTVRATYIGTHIHKTIR